MAAIDDTLREIGTMSRQRDNAFAAAAAPLPAAARAMVMTVPIGTRVLDLISGKEGVVIDGKRENVVIPLT